jgi:FkbM family methyltransferase
MISKYIDYIISHTNMKPQNFLEIGSRDGLDANEIQDTFNIPADKIYLVEPFPLHINEIKNNFPQYKLFECGINLKKGKSKFYGINLLTKEYSGLSSFLDREDNVYEQAIELNALEILDIDTITGKELLDQIEEETIDLCDIDVEGMAYEVLVSFGDDISKFKTIHFECEKIQLWKNQFLYYDIKQYLKSKNFIEIYKDPIYHSQLDLIYINKTYGEIISSIIPS